MRMLTARTICGMLVALTIGASNVWADNATEEQKPSLEARYNEMLTSVKAEITAALPTIDAQKRTAYLESRKAEDAANAKVTKANQNLGKIAGAQGLIGHAKNHWIKKADNGIKKAQDDLKKAATDDARKAAEAELAKWQRNRDAGVQALAERTRAYEALKKQEPQLKRELEAAQAVLAKAKETTLEAIHRLGLNPILSSTTLDAKLAKFVVLSEAKPKRLADFAEQSKGNEALVEKLLADAELMLQMVVADGAADGHYGPAMKIYSDIQKASDKAGEGVLQRLALAISLEHATPVKQRNAATATDAPSHVDPVKRYLHYEKAYLNSELDSNFTGLHVWDYRFIVDGDEPDEILAWGREMLRNYRPDHITTANEQWRYVALVRTDIRYGSQDNKHDRKDLQFYQNILKNGGICGRRAFIGRFILRAFGIPTAARPQRGHGALVRWTPNGWVPVLGAGWGSGWTKTRYKADRDFLANTQARQAGERYLEVKRAQWIGDVVGEKPVFGLNAGTPGVWYGVSLYHQQELIRALDAKELGAVGEELSEANESNVQYAFESAELDEADQKISVSENGVIRIPAVAASNPTKSTGKVIFMKSFGGGRQLHYSRGSGATVEYTVDAPAAGNYTLTAKIVTPSWQQHLLLSANGAEPIDIALPNTVGMWEQTEPVKINLAAGKNVLRFSHKSSGQSKGVTIKDFTLTPVN